jgi:hypothetical protein
MFAVKVAYNFEVTARGLGVRAEIAGGEGVLSALKRGLGLSASFCLSFIFWGRSTANYLKARRSCCARNNYNLYIIYT